MLLHIVPSGLHLLEELDQSFLNELDVVDLSFPFSTVQAQHTSAPPVEHILMMLVLGVSVSILSVHDSWDSSPKHVNNTEKEHGQTVTTW